MNSERKKKIFKTCHSTYRSISNECLNRKKKSVQFQNYIKFLKSQNTHDEKQIMNANVFLI